MTNTIKFWYNLTVQWTFEPFINWIRSFQYVERKAFDKINTFQCHLVTFRVFSLHSSLSMDPFRWDAHHFQLNVHHLSFSSFFAVSLEIYLRRKIKIDYLFFSSCSSSRSMWRKNISFPIFFSETKWNNEYKRGHYSYLPFSYFPMNAATSEVYIQIDEFVYNFPPKQERKKYQNDFSCNAKFMRRLFGWKGATFLDYNVFRIQKNDAIFFRHFERVLSSVEEKNHIENIRWIFQYVRPLFYWNHVNNFSIIKCQRMMKQDSFCRYFVVYFYLDALNKSSSQWNFFSFCFFFGRNSSCHICCTFSWFCNYDKLFM